MDAASYESVCRYVGQLYLQSCRELDELRARLEKAERERDEAVRLASEGKR